MSNRIPEIVKDKPIFSNEYASAQEESGEASSRKQNDNKTNKSRYCIFRYYAEANQMQAETDKKNKTGDGCSEFRNAIMKLMDGTGLIGEKKAEIQNGTFSKFLYTQKHVGTSSFLTLLSKKCELDYAYIDLYNPYYDGYDNYFNQLSIFFKNYELTTNNLKQFLLSLYKDFCLSRREKDLGKGYYHGRKIINVELMNKILNLIENLKTDFNERERGLYSEKNYYKTNKTLEPCGDFLLLKDKFLTDKEIALQDIEKIICEKDIEEINSDNGNNVLNKKSERKLLLIDNFDIALCNLYKQRKLSIKKIVILRKKWITAIKEINLDSANQLTCVVALRQREPDYEYRDGISLRRSWHSISKKYVGAFFAELLYIIQNVKKLSIYDSKYGAQSINCSSINNNNEEVYCQYAFTEEDLERIVGQVNGEVDEFLKSKLKFIELCEDNPYFIVRPMIQGLKYQSCVETNNEFAIDRHIKEWFITQWELPPEGVLPFDDFLGTLPLYLPEKITLKEYKCIYKGAVAFFKQAIKNSKNNSIVPLDILNDLEESLKGSLLKHDMYKRIVRALKDSYALFQDEVQTKKNDIDHTELNEYSIHKFVRYVYSDDEYFSQF